MEQTRTACEQVWREAMEHCRIVLGEDDYDAIVVFESPDQLITALGNLETQYGGGGTIPRLLNWIVPQLQTLNTFITIVLLAMGPTTISAACVWGAMSLLIQLASQSEKTLSEIVDLLGGIHKSITLFEIYSESIQLDPEFLKTLFDILVDLLSCSAVTIKHFRKNDIQTATVVISWSTVRTKFSTILKDIADKADYLKNIAEAQNIKQLSQTHAKLAKTLEGLAIAQPTTGLEKIALPCHFLPFGHNPGFYGRTTILQRIKDTLSVRDDNQRIRSVALWGTGGIGKSQIALEFASRQSSAEIPIILWISSEKETEVASAFNKAAEKLKLAGFLPSNTPDQNRDLVLEYLQRTADMADSGPWQHHCRSEFRVDSLVDQAIEVPTFTTEEGGDFILKHVCQRSKTDEDVKYAQILSGKLSGLALALEIISKQIKHRRTTVEQFLPFYDRNRQVMNKEPKNAPKNPYYNKDLETVWETAFDSFSEGALKLLMLLSFVAPTDIPEFIFTQGKELGDYAFLGDEILLDDAKLELVNLSLVSVNGEALLISLHLLTQQAYFDRMNLENRRAAFKTLIDLLQDRFSRTAGRHLYSRWKLCSSLIQHVHALVDRYMELGNTKFFKPSEPLTYLITNAAWYLQETGAFAASEALIEAAFLNCVDKNSLACAWLADTAGTIHDRQGHAQIALDYQQRALNINLEKSPHNSVEVANAYSAVGTEFTALWRAPEAINYLMKAIATMPANHDEKLKFNPDRYLRNRARAYFVNGNYAASKTDLIEAEHWQSLIYGDGSHYHGECAYMFGKIAAAQDSLDDAHSHFTTAIALMSIGKPTHASVGAAKFQQGYICMRQGNDMEALRLFRDSLTIAQMNEVGKGTQADSARVKWRMSQVMERQGMCEEAEAFKEAAEATKRSLLATGLFPQGQGEEQEYDSLVGLLYR